MTEKILLKDRLFNPQKVAILSTEISAVYPAFEAENFYTEVINAFPNLELKERIFWITACLKKFLPDEYEGAIRILLAALPAINDPTKTDDDFGDFIYAPYSYFVSHYGCIKKYLKISLEALREITMRFSAEDAIRSFLNAFPNETLETLKKWSQDEHYHVRRLCSEGTRPKLPWCQKLSLDIHEALPLLDILFADQTRYVTRSVANHLNDIAKIDPDIPITLLKKWKASGNQDPKEMDYIIRHGLRTLIKSGNANALALIGVSKNIDFSLNNFTADTSVMIGEALTFSGEILCNQETPVIIDYRIWFQNAAGQMKNSKVFKLTQINIKTGQITVFQKKHLFKKDMTTRKLSAGMHTLEILINGNIACEHIFCLK